MVYMLNIIKNRAYLYLLILLMPSLLASQSQISETERLHSKIDELSQIIDQLKAERSLSGDIKEVLTGHQKDYSKYDSLRLVSLRRKQEESRARIDALTMDVIRLSKQLEDPRKRYALAKKLKRNQIKKLVTPEDDRNESTVVIDSISVRSIDLAAVKLVRQGKSLDQARLLCLDKLTKQQVLGFYQGLAKNERYKLYDIADDIVKSKGSNLVDARRSAIYFYLYTQ